jgi:hypothetical protein
MTPYELTGMLVNQLVAPETEKIRVRFSFLDFLLYCQLFCQHQQYPLLPMFCIKADDPKW